MSATPWELPPSGGSRIAIDGEGGRMSFAELEARVAALTAALDETPTTTVVGLRMGNLPAFLVGCHACLRAGRTVVFLDPLWKSKELEAAAAAVVVDLLLQVEEETRASAEQAFDAPSWLLHADGSLHSGGPPVPSSPAQEASSLAMVHWSSGSTGMPKPIRVTRSALAQRWASMEEVFAPRPEDVTLCALPLSHCHGIECLALPTLAAGGTLVLMDPLAATAEATARAIEAHGVSLFSALPRFYGELLELDPAPSALASLRIVFCGSAALKPEVAQACEDRFGFRIQVAYGLTEFGVVCLNRHLDAPLRFASVGPVLPGIEWRIDAPDAEGVGELCLRGPGAALSDQDWFCTQDLVRADPDGYLQVVGRISRFLNLNGAKVDPAEVEEVLASLAWVAEVAVQGMVGADGIERLAAYVVPRAGETPQFPAEEVRLFAAEHLALFKVPTFVHLLEALPRSSVGKVRYAELPACAPEPGVLQDLPSTSTYSDSTERTLADIWCRVLGLPAVDPNRSFTDHGGTSIQLLEVLEAIRTACGQELEIVDMFRYPTLQHLAAALRGEAETATLSEAQERARRQREALRKQGRGSR